MEQVHFAEAVMKAAEATLQQYTQHPPGGRDDPEERRRLVCELKGATDQYMRLLGELAAPKSPEPKKVRYCPV